MTKSNAHPTPPPFAIYATYAQNTYVCTYIYRVFHPSLEWPKKKRVLLQWLAVLAGIGCLVIVDFRKSPFEYTEAQYVVGVGLVFVAMQAHEGVIMSVTSKIIPVELAR